MPEENSNMDKMLKAYATKRRGEAGAPLELHPATRRMLQGEIQRTVKTGAAPAAAKPKILWGLWTRAAIGAGLCGLFVAMLMLFETKNVNRSPGSLAQNEVPATAAIEADYKEPEPAPAPGANPSPVLAEETEKRSAGLDDFKERNEPARERSLKDAEPAIERSLAKAAPEEAKSFTTKSLQPREEPKQPAVSSKPGVESAPDIASVDRSNKTEIPAAAPALAGSQQTIDTRAAKKAEAEVQVATKTLSGKPVGTVSESFAKAKSSRADQPASAGARMKFTRENSRSQYRQNLLSPAQPEVMKSFQISRVGNQIRIFDADGSIYEGKIIESADKLAVPSEDSGLKADSKKAENINTSRKIYSFEATGKNRELNRVVVVKGSLTQTNVIQTATASDTGGIPTRGGAGGLAAPAKQAQVVGAVIQATVNIGGTNEFDINAQQVAP